MFGKNKTNNNIKKFIKKPARNNRRTENYKMRRSLFYGVKAAIAVILFCSAGLFIGRAGETQNSEKNKPIVRIYLQPYVPVSAEVDGQSVKAKYKRVEKTLGYVEFEWPYKKIDINTRFHLKLKRILNKNARSIIKTVYDGPLSLLAPGEGFLYDTILLQRMGDVYLPVGYYEVGEKPKSVNFINDRQVVVPLLDATGVSVVDTQTGRITRLNVPEKYIGQSGFVESLAIKPARELWISQMTSSIHVFDLSTLQYKTTITLTGSWTKFMAYDNKRKRVYASNWLSENISIIDASKKKEIDTLTTGGIPRGLLLSDDNNSLYVTLYSGNKADTIKGKLVKADLNTKKITDIPGERGAKRHVVRDGRGRIFVSDMLNAIIEVIDEKTLKVIKTIRVYDKPNTIALSPSKDLLYVSCRGPNNPQSYLLKGEKFGKLIVIDVKNLEKIYELDGGNQPTGLDVSPGGEFVVLSDFLDKRIRVYRAGDFRTVPSPE